MRVRTILRATPLCWVILITASARAQVDNRCRLSSLNAMLKPGQRLTIEANGAAPASVLYQGVEEREYVFLASITTASGDSARSFRSEEVSRIRYEKRGGLSPLTMTIATLGGAGVGALIGAFVDPAESLPSGSVGNDEEKGPVAGAIAGGVVGLAAGTIIPLVLHRTYVIEF
jgi:hypothetical protein